MTGTTGDANAMAAIDGNKNSWWHTNYVGQDTCSEPHWIAVDFGGEETFDKFLYTGRGSSSNGSIKDYRLEIKDAQGNYTVIKEGTFSSESNENIVELDKDYTGYGIRLTALSTHNGQNFAAAVEIDVAKNDIMATENEITQVKNTIIEDAKTINLDNYSTVTAKPVADLVAKIEIMNTASKNALDLLTKEYNELKAALINVAELKAAIIEGEKLDSDNYTAESYQVFADALVVAKATVINAITDEEVIQASEALATAKEALAKVEIDTDKTALKIAIDMANVITDEDLANVVSAVVDEFIAARDEANAVYNNASASQVEVNNAFDRLASAMHMLDFVKGDKTALKAFIDKVSGLESIKYTETTWTTFETELTEAVAVYNDENA
ncbi:MAG: discoidin domain-containing protein, partial [Thomasclavelia spiroformis]